MQFLKDLRFFEEKSSGKPRKVNIKSVVERNTRWSELCFALLLIFPVGHFLRISQKLLIQKIMSVKLSKCALTAFVLAFRTIVKISNIKSLLNIKIFSVFILRHKHTQAGYTNHQMLQIFISPPPQKKDIIQENVYIFYSTFIVYILHLSFPPYFPTHMRTNFRCKNINPEKYPKI